MLSSLFSSHIFTVFLMSHDKRGVSGAKLLRDIGVSYPTAWLMLHKLRKAMRDRDSEYMLSKIVEVDDTYFGAPELQTINAHVDMAREERGRASSTKNRTRRRNS